jgi:hypothetical protein
MRDMLNNKTMVQLGTLTLSGVTPGLTGYVDLRGFDACTIVLTTGAVTDAGTAAGFTATLQESADTAAASAVSVAAAQAVDGVVTLAVTADGDDNKVIGGLGYKGSARYAGLSITGTTGTDAVVSVYALLNMPHRAPTTFVGTVVART